MCMCVESASKYYLELLEYHGQNAFVLLPVFEVFHWPWCYAYISYQKVYYNYLVGHIIILLVLSKRVDKNTTEILGLHFDRSSSYRTMAVMSSFFFIVGFAIERFIWEIMAEMLKFVDPPPPCQLHILYKYSLGNFEIEWINWLGNARFINIHNSCNCDG